MLSCQRNIKRESLSSVFLSAIKDTWTQASTNVQLKVFKFILQRVFPHIASLNLFMIEIQAASSCNKKSLAWKRFIFIVESLISLMMKSNFNLTLPQTFFPLSFKARRCRLDWVSIFFLLRLHFIVSWSKS